MTQTEVPIEVELRGLYKAHYRFQFLSAGFQLGLFALVEKEPGLAVREIAARLDLKEQPTRILLLGCTVFGLLRKDGEGYRTTPLSKPLTANFDESPASNIPWEQHGIYRAMAWFCESLKEDTNIGLRREIPGTAPTLYGRLAENPELESTFHTMMSSVSRLVGAELGEKLDLSGCGHLLDIGGGTAINAASLAARWPDLRITIADLPSVATAANEKIGKLGLADRVRAVSLDAFHDEFPTGCDGVLFAHFLEIWSPERIRALLAKAARALPPGGGIYVVTPRQDDDGTGPERAAMLSAYFHTIASGEGMVYTGAEYEQWFRAVGFEPTGRLPLGADTVVITGRKA
ncbi:methyltransferase [Streptomyces sp. NPDC056669]|uniref:methyltransferase n=1 Tax=Streptomyces sp. NPDC056669 TaxID=3345903 RepID=UPI0036A2A5E0